MNIFKGCLANQADLNYEWNQYIDALMKVANRLEGPFNIESVVDPIDVKISEAIMNFQENSETVSTKVFQGCGTPRVSRKKRGTDGVLNVGEQAAAPSGGDTRLEKRAVEGRDDFYGSNDRRDSARPTTAAGTSLDRLVRDIKKKVSVAKDFWKNLPHSICNDAAAPPSNENNCWNGLSKSRYMPEVMDDGLFNQNNNPEVEVDVRRPNAIVSQQLLQLRMITARLKNAYKGLDVDYVDTADTLASGSGDDGSGSGNGGSGDSIDQHDDISFQQPTMQPPVVRTRRPGTKSASGMDGHPNHAMRSIVSWTLLVTVITTVALLQRVC